MHCACMYKWPEGKPSNQPSKYRQICKWVYLEFPSNQNRNKRRLSIRCCWKCCTAGKEMDRRNCFRYRRVVIIFYRFKYFLFSKLLKSMDAPRLHWLLMKCKRKPTTKWLIEEIHLKLTKERRKKNAQQQHCKHELTDKKVYPKRIHRLKISRSINERWLLLVVAYLSHSPSVCVCGWLCVLIVWLNFVISKSWNWMHTCARTHKQFTLHAQQTVQYGKIKS